MPDKLRTLDQVLGPELGALVDEAVAEDPPGPGHFIEVSPDRSHVQWIDARDCRHELFLRDGEIVFSLDEDADDDDDDDDDDGEQVA